MRFLAAGDLHMGAGAKGLPDALAGQYSGIATWRLLVREAVARQVEAVLLLGDVVDWGNRFFEALGPLTEGISALREQKIRVFAVAGNHDAEALGSIARVAQLENFALLGRGGQWEWRILPSDAGPPVQLFGWSFPERHYALNPFASFPRDDVDSACIGLGLLHADRDSAGSRYAPVHASDFLATGVGHWVLGHIHKPDALPGGGAVYTGSPSGMDASETGLHGALLLELGSHPPSYQRVPLSGLRYEQVALELGEVANVGDVQTHLVERARAWAAPLIAEQPGVEHLVLSGCCRALTRVSEKTLYDEGLQNLLQGKEPLPLADGRQLWFMGVTLDFAPPVIPEELAREEGILGQTARLILSLQAPAERALPEDIQALLRRAGQRDKETAARGIFRDLPQEATASPADARAVLLRQAWRLLAELHARREVQP